LCINIFISAGNDCKRAVTARSTYCSTIIGTLLIITYLQVDPRKAELNQNIVQLSIRMVFPSFFRGNLSKKGNLR